MKRELNLRFRLVKILDIGYVAAIYFLIGIYLSTVMDNYFGKFDKEAAKKEPFWKFTLNCIGHLWLVGIILYIVRNLGEFIPSPLHGIAGYDHYRLKELTSAAVFGVIFVMYQKNLKDKLDFMYERMIALHKA
jgi:hypothetical protein